MENWFCLALFVLAVVRLVQSSETEIIFEVFTENFKNNNTRSLCGTQEFENERGEIIVASNCRVPHEVFVQIPAPGSHIKVIPSAVWVKRCVGVCTNRKSCQPRRNEKSIRTKAIPVRYTNVATRIETCDYYYLEEHLECYCAKT